MILTTIGFYPREKAISKVLKKHNKGKIPKKEMEEELYTFSKKVIEEQISYGIDLPTTGLLAWDDLFTPVANEIEGFSINGLTRFFENNFYYHQPVAESDFGKITSTLSERFSKLRKDYPVKAVLPGPFTMAHMSINEHFESTEDFSVALAEKLHEIAVNFQEAGAQFLQIDEPLIVNRDMDKDDLALLKKTISIMVEDLEMKIGLYTYFGNVESVLSSVLELPINVFGFDDVAHNNLKVIEEYHAENGLPEGIGLGLGAVDALNTKMEKPEELNDKYSRAKEIVGEENVNIGPNYSLDLIPYSKAQEKLQNLGNVFKGGEN